MLEIKTCQPIIAGFESSELSLAIIKTAIPEATEAHLISDEIVDYGAARVYLYYVYAGDIATFKIPNGTLGDRARIELKNVNESFDYTGADKVLPTSLVKIYLQYHH